MQAYEGRYEKLHSKYKDLSHEELLQELILIKTENECLRNTVHYFNLKGATE